MGIHVGQEKHDREKGGGRESPVISHSQRSLLNPPTFPPKPSSAPSLSTPAMPRMLNYDCALPNKELLVKGYKNSILFIN